MKEVSLLIKGLNIPKEDELLCIKIYPSGKVTFDMDLQCKQIAEAFELSDHGDLIERPVLIDELAISEEPDDCRGCASYNSYDDFCCRTLDFQNMCKSIRTATVVIPAERSEK